MFTLDTESGFRDVVLINGAWGLGEMIVQGRVTPDEFLVWKSGLEQKKLHPIIDRRLGVKLEKMVYAQSGHGIQQTKIEHTTPSERTQFVLSDKEVLLLAK
jgi:pyruvate,water dikinase